MILIKLNAFAKLTQIYFKSHFLVWATKGQKLKEKNISRMNYEGGVERKI